MGDTLLKILIFEYVIIAAAYGFGGDWPRVLYFVAAALISVAVILMK